MRPKTLVLIASTLALLGPAFAQAAQIYIDPSTGKYPPGVTFSVDVRLDNQGQCINAAEVDVAYPKDQLQAVDVSEGNSIFSLSIKEPTIYKDYGVISFVGGLPGGYCGRIAGDPSLSNKLATLIFRFPTSSKPFPTGTLVQGAQLSFLPTTKAVLNDGLGTIAGLTTSGASYTIIAKGQFAPISSWLDAIQADTTPPEPFTVGVYRDRSLFDNQSFAVFSTVDKQTGVDHYEAAEVSAADVKLDHSQWNWARAVSPYLIKNQNLSGVVAVRAIDKAGNQREAQYQMVKPGTNGGRGWTASIIPQLAIIGIVAFSIVQIAIRLFF